MKLLLLLSVISLSSFASDNLTFKSLLGKTYEVESIKVKAKDKTFVKNIEGIQSVRFQKDEVKNDIMMIIESHDNADMINQNMFTMLTRPDHRLGVSFTKKKNNILWCEEERVKVNEVSERKVKSSYVDKTYMFCFKLLGGKNSKSKVVITKKGDKLIIKTLFKRYNEVLKRHKYRKRAVITLK